MYASPPYCRVTPVAYPTVLKLLAFVDGRNFLLEVDDGGQAVDAVLFGLLVVVQSDQHDAFLVQVVVNVLQLVEHTQVLLVVLVV